MAQQTEENVLTDEQISLYHEQLPYFRNIDDGTVFYSTHDSTKRTNYFLSRVEVKRWLNIVGIDGLQILFKRVKSEENFYTVYQDLENSHLK